MIEVAAFVKCSFMPGATLFPVATPPCLKELRHARRRTASSFDRPSMRECVGAATAWPLRPLSEVRAVPGRFRRCETCVRGIIDSPRPLSTSRGSECAGFAISPPAHLGSGRISHSRIGRMGGPGDRRRIRCAAFVKGISGHVEESRVACLRIIRGRDAFPQ